MLVHVNMLGKFRVAVDAHDIADTDWRRERSAALVKLLALSTGHQLHREQAMETLWPDLSADAAGANLRKAIHFARRALGDHELISVNNDIVTLAADQELVIDAEGFEQRAKSALKAGDPAACVQAAEQYGGELLPEDRYIDWTEALRERLRQLYIRVLRTGGLWEQLLALDPTDEAAQRALMQAALDAGNRGEVIRQFQRLRERLRVDLGVGPAPATVAIYERALAAETVEPPNITDHIRGSLAWGIVHLQSGEYAKAEATAKQARLLAIDAGLAREVGEASALFGLAAHRQGRWAELFRTEFIDCIRRDPTYTSNVLDAHLCLAEFCLYDASGHEHGARLARELLAIADTANSDPGRALATLILGEGELYSGNLDTAEQLLTDSGQLYQGVGSQAGQAISLQRLAEIAVLRGQNYRAGRLVQKGFRIAESSWLTPHLLIRLQALAIQTAGSKAQAQELIREGDRWIAKSDMCQPCSMSFRVAASIAQVEAGELEQASRRLDEAERLAGMWNGGPWVAAVWEGRAVYRQAQGDTERAAALFREAAERYALLGRAGDQERCLARAVTV